MKMHNNLFICKNNIKKFKTTSIVENSIDKEEALKDFIDDNNLNLFA